MRVITVEVICVLNAEQAVPSAVFLRLQRHVQCIAQYSEGDETELLYLLIFFLHFLCIA